VHWIRGDLVYHEGSAVVVCESEIRIWDATAGWWADAAQVTGYSGVLALRVLTPKEEPPSQFSWGIHRIPNNRWQELNVPAASSS
jgi:hypothetical protein